ncbi:MAG: L-lactate dehydrogenase [candidate division KSB1 bacterium]|nr:L-lactate dehydrogenase [candidate division KSB1 bacterium]
MAKVAVIGAGDVGATVAYTLQMAGVATELVLVDIDRDKARGEALDMSHGVFFTGPMKIVAGDMEDVRGAAVVIVTAGARQRPGETRMQLVQRNADICTALAKEIGALCPEAVVVVTTNPVDVMTMLVQEHAGLPIPQVVGSGTVLDSARFRFTLSQHCEVDPRNVHAYVIGEHGDSEVFLWSSVNIAGVPLHAFCRGCARACTPGFRDSVERTVRNSAYHIIEAKGYTSYGVSQAVLRIVQAIIRDEHSLLTVSTRLTGEYGLREVCLSVPCVVGRKGVLRLVETELTAREHEALLRSAELIRANVPGKR